MFGKMFEKGRIEKRLNNPPKHLGVRGKNSGIVVIITVALILAMAFVQIGFTGMIILGAVLTIALFSGIFFYPILMSAFLILLMAVLGVF